MSTQSHRLHRALLRPFILHTLRAAGFHGARPAVIDTVTDLAERYLLLLAQTTASHAASAHNDPVPTVTDVRLALQDCGVLAPVLSGGEEEWRERMRRPLAILGREVAAMGGKAGSEAIVERRVGAEKRKREDEDLADVRAFESWIESSQFREIKRVAGLTPDPASLVAGPGAAAAAAGGPVPVTAGGGLPAAAVGVGGGVVQAEDFLTRLKRKGKIGVVGAVDDARFVGTVLGEPAEGRKVVIEGGPVGSIREWRPKVRITQNSSSGETEAKGVVVGEETAAVSAPAVASTA